MQKTKNTNHTIPLQLKYGRVVSRTLISAFPIEELAIRMSGVFIAILVFLYLLLVGMTILNVISRKEALDEITRLRTSVGDLERQYFAASQVVTPDQATDLGLSPISRIVYVHRPGFLTAQAGAGVTSGRNEI